MENSTHLKAEQLKKFFLSVLSAARVREDVARYMAEGLIQASLRGIDSHGIRLLPHYIEGLEQGRLNPSPDYKFEQTALATGRLDADHAPGHAAGMEGMAKAIELAKKAGLGAVAVSNSSHFGAAAYYAFKAAEEDMIGLSFTHATAHVLSFGGVRPFFGNNPICLVAPCEGEGPFCLDMATTVATFNKVQQYKEMEKKMPKGWAVDASGQDVEDASLVASLLPIGGYKGFGLSMMVDIICALLSGAPFGPQVSRMFGTSMNEKRRLGHFFVAISIAAFEDPKVFKHRLKEMMDMIRKEPSQDPSAPVMVPGDPEKKICAIRSKNGIPVTDIVMEQFMALAQKYGLPLTSFE